MKNTETDYFLDFCKHNKLFLTIYTPKYHLEKEWGNFSNDIYQGYDVHVHQENESQQLTFLLRHRSDEISHIPNDIVQRLKTHKEDRASLEK